MAVSGDKLADRGTEIDAHIEDRETRVAACSTLGVEVADDGRNIRFEQSGAEDYKDQADKE